MSGGYFDYKQYCLDEMIDRIEEYVSGRELDEEEIQEMITDKYYDDDYIEYAKKHNKTMPNYYCFNKTAMDRMRYGLKVIKKARVYLQRIDWLLSGDDGDDTFIRRLEEELKEIK